MSGSSTGHMAAPIYGRESATHVCTKTISNFIFTMFNCIVCGFSCKLSIDLQNHVHRHRKSDLISAVFKLPRVQDDDAQEEVNNNECESKRNQPRANLRRSSRNKEVIRSEEKSSPDAIIDENYYMPDASTSKLPPPSEDESDDSIMMKQLKRNKSRRKVSKNRNVEPMLLTPKIRKASPSDTDSCSGNGIRSDDRVFCTYCGSGYRSEGVLAEHIRKNHLNFCTMCEVNFPDLRRYKEHTEKHLVKVFVCQYCDMEFTAKDIFALHVDRHLQSSVLDDVLSLEKQFFTEKTYMNSMYNMFNAGFQYGRRTMATFDSSVKQPPEFYKVFLQYATQDSEKVDNYGYLCRTCGFTLFDDAHYKDHMQIAHGIECNIEEFLNI